MQITESSKAKLIQDNPNLRHSVIARLLGETTKQVFNKRASLGWKKSWLHKGCGIPFTNQYVMSGSTLSYRVEFSGRVIFSGSVGEVMKNVDRLIFCLENNNGKLPPTRLDGIFDNLGFVKVNNEIEVEV